MYRTLVAPAARSTVALSAHHARSLSTSPVSYKTVTEKVSEVADKVNKSVGEGLASAIETGENATEKTKEAAGGAKKDADEVTGKLSDIAGQKKNKASAEAKATKEEVKDATRK